MTLLGPGTYLTANDLTFHVVDRGRPDAPAVVLLHGFPDSAELWRKQVPDLVDAGYRVIAPDLRGFGRSGKPTKTTDYELPVLASDVLGILAALGVGRFHLVGHDFGAVLAWLLASFMSLRTTLPESDAMARMHPAIATVLRAATVKLELLSLTAMSVGHPRAYKRVGLDQREKSWYILFFQFERAEGALAANEYQLLRAWSGGPMPAGHPEAARWIEHFRTDPGNLRAALNWYRANTHPDRSVADRDDIPTIAVRTQGIWGEGDPHQTEAPMRKSGEFVDPEAGYCYERLAGGGHWMPLDRPGEVTGLLLKWLGQ